MRISNLWIKVVEICTSVGAFLAFLFSQAGAQGVDPRWSIGRMATLHRGQIGHSVFNEGMSGWRDHVLRKSSGRFEQSSFSYPMGQALKVYSGGLARVGWNARRMTGGEGVWIMSKTAGQVHVSTAGSEQVSQDVESLPQDPSAYPEAYLGLTHDEDWALSLRQNNGNESDQVKGAPLRGRFTNWWPTSGGLRAAPTPVQNRPVMVWNHRFGRYNSGRKYQERIATGEFEQMPAPAWAEALSEDDFPEQVAITKARSRDTGLQWTRKWYQWGHSDFDDFLINETVVQNTSTEVREGVYIVIQNRFMSGATFTWRAGGGWGYRLHPWARDDHARSTVATNYLNGVSREDFVAGAGKPAGLPFGKALAEKGHAMLYCHDGESDHIDNLIPDVGDPYRYVLALERFTRDQPWIREGHIQHGQYFGIGVIDAFPPFNTYGGADPEAYIAPHDNPDTPLNEAQKQPASVTMWRVADQFQFDYPSPLADVPEYLYDTLTLAGYPDEPDEPFSYSHFQTFGPYTLNPGEQCKVVVAYVGGTGADDPKYASYRRYPQPFTFGWMNLFGGTGQAYVNFRDRQKEIPSGEDALFRHFQRAIDVYNWGYDLPNQPPNVKLSWRSNLDGQTTLSWSAFGEDTADPDYAGEEAQDLRGYRIYRTEVEYMGPWEFVAEFTFEDAQRGNLPAGFTFDPTGVFRTNPNSVFPEGIPLRENPYVGGLDPGAGPEIPGLYQYTDRSSKPGFSTHYAVRLYDSGHRDWNGTGQSIPPFESAPGPSGGAIVGGVTGIVPVIPGSEIFDRLEAQVKVVPNPYKIDSDLHTYNRSANIRFTNLPGRCQIDLYDVTGQRIWTFFHNNLLTGEEVYTQFTENRPSNFGSALAPGIYFWKVASLMPGSEGKEQSGTFVIIK